MNPVVYHLLQNNSQLNTILKLFYKFHIFISELTAFSLVVAN
jgi:hypothetical protein